MYDRIYEKLSVMNGINSEEATGEIKLWGLISGSGI